MTPDERADRAERVIAETVSEFFELVEWLRLDAARMGSTAAVALEQAASILERNARIAGIALDKRRD